ncbi:MAG: NTP transferase domain-containing protein [Verrucomicrobia bacterium]|nr:NTP transferase domain-containing protein [Verrucomicrobiota bacterium]
MENNTSAKVASVILAGGEGTRLFPLTQSRCKPDVCFAGQYHLIDIPLSNSLNSKIRNIFVLTQHFISSLHQHIYSTYPEGLFQNRSIQLISPRERKMTFQGTADAVRKSLDQIMASPFEYLLILSGDQLYQMDYNRLIDFAKNEGADLVIATLEVPEAEAKRMGLLKLGADSKITDFIEKPQDPEVLNQFVLPSGKYLGSMGIYVFKREALAALLKEQGDDFGKHLIPSQIKKGKTSAYVHEGYWEDIGTIASYHGAHLSLMTPDNWMAGYDREHPLYTPYHSPSPPMIKNTLVRDSLINSGAIVEAKEVCRSVIGTNVKIKAGTIIYNTVISGDPPAEIGKDCLIRNAIIDSNTTIGDCVQLINKNNLENYDGKGVYIRDGIIIVSSGTKLPSDFIL